MTFRADDRRWWSSIRRATWLVALMVLVATFAPAAPVRDTFSDTWGATDGVGRTLPGAKICGSPRREKVVGIFYFLWMTGGQPVYDLTRLLEANPAAPAYGPEHAFHWWGQPHLGYYRSDDTSVIRTHAQMLCDAGVDVIVFDVTNALTYDRAFLTVCRTFTELRRVGRPTPAIAFLTHSRHVPTTQHLYDVLYSKQKHADLWFKWQGKPLLMGSSVGLPDAVRNAFTFRESWAWTNPRGWFKDGKDKWPWLDNYPQQPGWHESPDKPEQVAVCSAQHPVSNIGRSFHNGRQPPRNEWQTALGPCFAEQWRRALQVDPSFVFVTGWNEWIAQRFVKGKTGGAGHFLGKPLRPGDTHFIDQYNQEYSRDIEPMRGGHGDAYYYQMVANIRRFKGVRAVPKPSRPRTVAINNDFSQWRDVQPEYRDDRGDTAHRNHKGYADSLNYAEASGRNDIVVAKVARDDERLFFYARTEAPLTRPADARWMWLLVNVDGKSATGWHGFDMLINRTRTGAQRASVESHAGGGWKWKRVGEAELAWKGNDLHLGIPRTLLAAAPDRGPLRLAFKWADNLPATPDIMDCIDKGDVAPNGRFTYRFRED